MTEWGRSAVRAEGPGDRHLAGDGAVLALDGDGDGELGAPAGVEFGDDVGGGAAEGRGGADRAAGDLLERDLGVDRERHGPGELVAEGGEDDRATGGIAEGEHRAGVRSADV